MPRKKSAESGKPVEPKRRGRPKKLASQEVVEPTEPAMASGVSEATPPTPKRRGRPRKVAAPTPAPTETEPAHAANAEPAPVEHEAVVTADEAALVAKYGHTHQIVPGSLRYAGGREGWHGKRTVEVRCCACPATRVVATSDLQWDTTRYCLGCAATVKRNRRAKKRQTKKKP